MQPSAQPNRLLGFGLAVLIAAFLIVLFYRGFTDPDEGRYSEIPREMVASGNWLEMRMLGYRYYEKPPLSYWLVAPAIRLFGAHDWAVRIPLFFNAIGLIWLFWKLIQRQWSPKSTGTALLVMLGMIGFMAGTGLLLTDAFLMLWFGLTCVCLFYGAQPDLPTWPRLLWFAVAAVSAALGFLTKGAVAFVLPGAIFFCWLIWERRLKALRTLALPAAAIIFFAILTPIMMVIEKHNPGFFYHFVYEEHLARFLGTRAQQLHPEPFWFFLMVLPLLLAPWTFFTARAACKIIVSRAWRTDTLLRFLLVWCIVVIGFFSAGTGKLMSYILPALPPLALLLGRWGLAEPLDGSRRDQMLWKIGVLGPLAITIALPIFWMTAYFQWLPKDIYAISGISVLGLLPAGIAALTVLLKKAWTKFEGIFAWNTGILLSAALLLSPLAGKDFNVLLHINSSYVFKKLAAQLCAEDQIIVFWSYRPALPFYTQHIYKPFQDKNELSYGMRMEPERPVDIQTIAELQTILTATPGRVFAVIEPRELETKFKPLGLRTKPTNLPRDPDTLILELLKPADAAP